MVGVVSIGFVGCVGIGIGSVGCIISGVFNRMSCILCICSCNCMIFSWVSCSFLTIDLILSVFVLFCRSVAVAFALMCGFVADR